MEMDLLLYEFREWLGALEANLPQRILPSKISHSAKLPFKAINYRNALSWRMAELTRAALDSFEKDKFAAAILLCRAAVETTAALWYLLSKIERALEEETLDEIDDCLMKLNLGTRTLPELPESINVLTFLKIVEKDVEGFRHSYDQMSEYAHPNYPGTVALYSKVDSQNHWENFGNGISNSDYPRYLFAANLNTALRLFEPNYNAVGTLMPRFVALCESELKKTSANPDA